MCGIVAVLARPARRQPPPAAQVLDLLGRSLQGLASLPQPSGTPAPSAEQLRLALGTLSQATASLAQLDGLLRGVPGLACLLGDQGVLTAVEHGAAEATAITSRFEALLDAGSPVLESDLTEKLNSALVLLRDATWAVAHDRAGCARSVSDLARSLGALSGTGAPSLPALGVLWAVQVALSSLDRLEVRGRDSAGIHLMLTGHGLDLSSGQVRDAMTGRLDDPLFPCCGVASDGPCLSFVYKTAKAIGELGDNVAALRHSIGTDPLLAKAMASPDLEVTVVGHTRWASVGVISEPNAHPLNSAGAGAAAGTGAASGTYVVGALNGDIDNHLQLVAAEELDFPPEVTTDAKLVPALVSRHLAAGTTLNEAFRLAVNDFDGSVGIAANASCSPGELLLALRGSGQSLNIGLADDAFVVASEPYGLVEETSRYLRMDGEGGGQLVVCRRDGAGSLEGLSRWEYEGKERPVAPDEILRAEITTRDVDRRGFKHFLLKEISESPLSVRKTLRGKVVTGESGELSVQLGDDVVPRALRNALQGGRLDQVIVIGQGTAAVAGQAVAIAISQLLPGVAVKATPATELSGWGLSGGGLPDDMSRILVVAISQSGTTTDTNRTVDLCRARGAHVVAIVNRRNSDLVQKSHGVLYTSDGRDIEMSVASTKAFYSQVVAGHLLATGLAAAAKSGPRAASRASELLSGLRELPALMEKVLALRPQISRVACVIAPPRRSWAVVGSGPDRVAAAEVRIKLSELCYKAIGLDSVEDKKHIDLSAEPMVLVCATSVSGANARDIAKEVAIFRAHKAAPFVIVSEGQEDLFGSGADVLAVPRCYPDLAFVLGAMVGHLFGYEAALCIDSQARPLREARAVLEGAIGVPLDQLAPSLEPATAPALAGLRSGAYDGHLNASTASRLTSLLRYATGAVPIEGYEAEMCKVGAPAAIALDVIEALSAAIDELTRPIDAIKHQAKTVTVGISRSEEPLLRAKLVVDVLATGASLESLGYRALRTLAALAPAVEEVLGYTRYRIDAGAGGDLEDATISVVDRGGVAAGLASRTANDGRLRGTKHRTAEKREVTVFRGLYDGRTGLMVPEVKGAQVTGITLLHARFAPALPARDMKPVLQAYQGRYTALVDAVTEAEPHFDDDVLGRIDVVELLTEPVAVLARHWAAAN